MSRHTSYSGKKKKKKKDPLGLGHHKMISDPRFINTWNSMLDTNGVAQYQEIRCLIT